MLTLVENLRRKQLAWVAAIQKHRNWNDSQLAKAARISHSTLSKWKNDPQGISQLQTTSVEKIEAVGGIPHYQTQAPETPRGLAEQETEPYDPSPRDPISGAISGFKGGRNGIDAWVLQSRALESAGYLPGDVLIVDLNATPKSGDAVCAQVYDRSGRAETVMRLYEDPFIVGATLERRLMRPMLVDGDRVVLRGVVVASFRPRRAA